jgi:hypothetical protein
MKPEIDAIAPAPKVDHRANRLLAALDSDDFAALAPHLHGVSLQQDQVLYEAGDPLRHAFFPHDMVVSLVAVLKDGRSAEMAVYGREGALGLVGSMMARQSFGRYIVQADGTASRIELERLHEVIGTRPKVAPAGADLCRSDDGPRAAERGLQRGPQCRGAVLPLDPEPARPAGSGHRAAHA